MQEKQHATQVWRKLPPIWNRSAGYKCERGAPFVDILPKYMLCIGVLTPGNLKFISKIKILHVIIIKNV